MEETHPAHKITFDGTNPDEVVAFLHRHSNKTIVKGGAVVEPAPGDHPTITVEYEDGSAFQVIEGDLVEADAASEHGVTARVKP